MIGIVLFIVATILFWILSPLFIIYALFKAGNLSVYFRNVALSIDQLGNTMGAPMMNSLLIKKNCIHLRFGNPDQTISYVLGINYKLNSLNKLGLLIVKILDKIEKQHVEKAVEYEQ